MRLHQFLFILCLVFTLDAFSQEESFCTLPDGVLDVVIQKNIQFGSNTKASGASQDLFMDVYIPVSEDSINRPVVVLAFGGAFITGRRSDIHRICQFIAQRGFVAVTIDYRLFDDMGRFPTKRESLDNAIKGVGDMKGAIRYLIKDANDANKYGINTNQIIVGGVSSGAIIANHVAYLQELDVEKESVLDTLIMQNGGIDGNSNALPSYDSSVIKGIISYSGAVLDKKFLGEEKVEFFGVHELDDEVVPYGSGTAKVFGIPFSEVEGSGVIKQVFDSLKVENTLIDIDSDEHVGYLFNSDSLFVLNKTMTFLNNLFCEPLSIIDNDENQQSISLYPNPASTTLSFSLGEIPISSIEIFSLDGVLLKEETINAFKGVNIEEFQPGVYLLRLRTNDQALFQFKFMKN